MTWQPLADETRNPHRILPFLAAGLLACTISSCKEAAPRGIGEAAAPSGAPDSRRLHTVAKQPWPRTIRIQGSLVADEESLIGARVAGRVEKVLVDRGSSVKKGDVLAELEQREFDLRIREAENELAQVRAKLGLKPTDPDEKLDPNKAPPVVQEKALVAEAEFLAERARKLVRERATAQEEVERHEAALSVARARHDSALNNVREQIALVALRRTALELAQQRKADSVITAPFDGVVQERHAAPGAYLQVGNPVASLVRIDPLRFRGGVPEREADKVEVGEAITIHVDGEKDPIPARISRLSPALTMANRSLIIEADVANPKQRMRAGLFAQADITIAPNEMVVVVPLAAITEFAGVEKVRVQHDRIEERRIATGRRANDLVEVLRGVKPGDVILLNTNEEQSSQPDADMAEAVEN